MFPLTFALPGRDRGGDAPPHWGASGRYSPAWRRSWRPCSSSRRVAWGRPLDRRGGTGRRSPAPKG